MIGDKFMPEMHLWDPKAKEYSACGPFTRHQQIINERLKIKSSCKEQIGCSLFST